MKNLTDGQIAKLVFPYSPYFKECEEAMRLPTQSSFRWGDGANWHDFNPCNNANDAWPLIRSIFNKLNAVVDYDLGSGTVKTTKWGAVKHAYKCNELKAAMLILLDEKG